MYLECLYLLTANETTTVEMMTMMTIAMVTKVETAMTMGRADELLGFKDVAGVEVGAE